MWFHLPNVSPITFQMYHYFSFPSSLPGCGCFTVKSYPKISEDTTNSGISWRLCLEFPELESQWDGDALVISSWFVFSAVSSPRNVSPLVSVGRVPSLNAKRWNRNDLSHFSFAWFVVLFFGKYKTWCVPNSEFSPHPEMVLFLLQSEGSGTDLFSSPLFVYHP